MNLDNFNNLIELFFYQAEKQKPESIFLEWLNPNNRKIFTWTETKQNILKLSKK
jgi:long-chain acyl-CoA synthetase